MKRHAIQVLILSVIILAITITILICTGVITFPSAHNPPNTHPEPITTPNVDSPDDDEFVSPYHPENNYTGCLMQVWNETINIDAMTITSPTQPHSTFLQYCSVEDVVTVALPRQNLGTDISQYKLIIVLHEKMQDPYITPPQNYTILTELLFTETQQGTLEASFQLGYGTGVGSFIDLLLVNNTQIEAFTMIRISAPTNNTKMFYEWKYPDKTVHTMIFQTPQDKWKYFYYAEDVVSLYDWAQSITNSQNWQQINGYITDADVEWYITPEQCTQILHDGITINVLPINADTNPFSPHEFQITNARYATYYLNQTCHDVISRFGQPRKIVALPDVTRIEYPKIIFYANNTNHIIQIDIHPDSHSVINGLPYHTSTLQDVLIACRTHNIKYGAIQDKSHTDLKFYTKYISLTIPNGYVSYVWEGELQINPNFTEFTRIVIHSDEEYIY